AAGVHVYRPVPTDRDGHALLHGDLDRAARVEQWRRIPAGGADLARYVLPLPPERAATVSVRLWRRERPEFSKWAGTTPAPPALLEPLARRFPRDTRLRSELGLAYLGELRNQDAAAQFGALLAVDPLDSAAHYNLMVCERRLNQVADARREETIYRLFSDHAQ